MRYTDRKGHGNGGLVPDVYVFTVRDRERPGILRPLHLDTPRNLRPLHLDTPRNLRPLHLDTAGTSRPVVVSGPRPRSAPGSCGCPRHPVPEPASACDPRRRTETPISAETGGLCARSERTMQWGAGDYPEGGRAGSPWAASLHGSIDHFDGWGSLRHRRELPLPGSDTLTCAAPRTADPQALWADANPKEIPLNMAQRRRIREMSQATSASDGSWKQWEDTPRRYLRHLQRDVRNALSYIEPWRNSLREIEGHFGTGIRSYFSIHRFLIALNFCVSLLLFALVVTPVIIYTTKQSSDAVSLPDTPLPPGNCSRYDYRNPGLVSFYEMILDLLSGTGFLEYSLLFYGFYPVEGQHEGGVSYQTPLAYLLTVAACFLLTFTCIVVRASLGYKQNYLLSGHSLTDYSRMVFCGWDFCISQPRVVFLRHRSITQELRMSLEEEQMRKARAERSRLQIFQLVAGRLLLTSLTLLIISAAFYAIYLATEFSQKPKSSPSQQRGGVQDLLIEYLPSIVITAVNLVTPPLFQLIITWERYSTATEIILTLLRCVFLKLASLGVLLYSLWNQITCHGHPYSDPRCIHCGYKYQQYQCWETKVGQEMYKLMIFDFLMALSVIIFVDFPRKMLVEFSGLELIRHWGAQEFMVPQNILDLVYGQALCWTGTIYSPLLPLLHTGKLILLFQLKKLTLFTNCQPCQRIFRSSSTITFFLLVLAMGFLISLAPLIYTLTSISPSRGCGPFRHLQTIWDVVPEAVSHLPDVPRSLLYFLGSLAFLVPLFALSSIVLLFLVVRDVGYKRTIAQLKVQLRQEGHDKQFLLQKIAALSHPGS
ncbi:transmembrane channel-like protein 7 [Mobula hypostoma]|uniref:transmembrane channel-like protein 7 n=1 Tax=Mobula hypostoma TaxID=723540 RepID=UPI002FC36D04